MHGLLSFCYTLLMARKNSIAHDIRDLEESKYNLRQEAARGFAQGALPSIISFGAIGAACGLGLALIGLATGTLTGVAMPALVIGGAALVGGTMATVTGGAHAFRHSREAQHRNRAIDHAVENMIAQAQEQGLDVPQSLRDKESPVAEHDTPFLQRILEDGKKTIDPKEIMKNAGDDVLTGLGRR